MSRGCLTEAEMYVFYTRHVQKMGGGELPLSFFKIIIKFIFTNLSIWGVVMGCVCIARLTDILQSVLKLSLSAYGSTEGKN